MKIRLTSESFDLTSELEKYADGKLAALSKHIPRQLRARADCGAHFVAVKRHGEKFNTCHIQCSFGDVELHAQETTAHMYAALDIAVVHIEQQLKDYLSKQKPPVYTRVKQRMQGSEWPTPGT